MDFVAEDLVIVKMHFFTYVASLLQPFLTFYQSSQPTLGFNYVVLVILIHVCWEMTFFLILNFFLNLEKRILLLYKY